MLKKSQITLFPITNPLRDQKWTEIFASVPKKAGVYSFLNAQGNVIYIGKAKNLCSRLKSYRFKDSSKVSTKLTYLVRTAVQIKWKVLTNEYQALLEEDRLIKYYKPSLNVVNNQFEQYYYLHFFRTEEPLKWKIVLSMRQDLADSEYCFGAFKGHKAFRTALGSLLRLLFILSLPKSRPKTIPVVLLRKLTPLSYVVLLRPYTRNRLFNFLRGRNYCLLKEFEHKISTMIKKLSKADALLLENDYARLYSFYYKNCKPLYHNTSTKAFTPKNILDTALIKWSNANKD